MSFKQLWQMAAGMVANVICTLSAEPNSTLRSKASRKYKHWPFRYLRTGQCVTCEPGQPGRPRREYWPLHSSRMGRVVGRVLAIAQLSHWPYRCMRISHYIINGPGWLEIQILAIPLMANWPMSSIRAWPTRASQTQILATA